MHMRIDLRALNRGDNCSVHQLCIIWPFCLSQRSMSQMSYSWEFICAAHQFLALVKSQYLHATSIHVVRMESSRYRWRLFVHVNQGELNRLST